MAEPFMGEIRIFGFNFPPRGWAKCDGQLLSTTQYQALFSILGTTYGGDGRTTFGLPDLRGTVPYSTGKNSIGDTYILGQKGGDEMITLHVSEIPTHTHQVVVSPNAASLPTGDGNYLAIGDVNYCSKNSSTNMSAAQIGAVGGQPHENRPPFLTVNFCIALDGTYPPHP